MKNSLEIIEFFSDGDENEYSEVQDGENIIFPQQINSYYGLNRTKRGIDNRSECDIPSERMQSLSQTPERNLRSLSVNTSDFVRQQPRLPPNNQNQEKQEKVKQIFNKLLLLN